MGRQPARRPAKAIAALAAGTAAALVTAVVGVAPTAAAPVPGTAASEVQPASAGDRLVQAVAAPLPTSACLKTYRLHCYTPAQYRKAYNLDPLYQSGITGKGRTIVLVDAFGSPTIQHDLDVFSKTFGLPSAKVNVVKWGDVPEFDANNPDQATWASETTLDVEYAHAIAPDAKIVLVVTPVAETQGMTGFPEIVAAENYMIKQGIGDVISQSFGATENTLPGFGRHDDPTLEGLRSAFKAAAARKVTVLAAAGDAGATNPMLDGKTMYKHRAVSWPSSDPLVTSVGGTALTLNDSGARLADDKVWNDSFGAGGGGVSGIFARPDYQRSVAGTVGDRRGTPDISMTAAVDGGAWVYSSYNPAQQGWRITGGTSQATPIFAGIVALAAQKANHRLGQINDDLYAMARHNTARSGLIDVTRGNNSFSGVKGYEAVKGYDLASGLGTIDGNAFVNALAARNR